MRFSPIVLAACIVLVVLAVMLFDRLPKQMFPLSERNQFLVYMNMPDGTDISETEGRALRGVAMAGRPAANPEIASQILYVGDGGPRFYLTLTPVPPDPASAFFLVNTKDYEGAVRAADRAWKYLYENHPEARFKIKRLAMGSVESGIVDVEISGPDADRLLALGKHGAIPVPRRAPDIRDNDDDWGNKVVKVVVEIDQDRARQLGMTSEEITQLPGHLFHRHRGLDLSRRRQRHSDRAAGRSGHLAKPGRPHQRDLCEEWRADLAGPDRHVEAGLRFLADTPQEPGADDHRHRPQRRR